MKILIFEADHHGHRLMGVRVLIETVLELELEHERHNCPGHDQCVPRENGQSQPLEIILAITDAGVRSEEFTEHLSQLSSRVHLTILPPINAQQSAWKVALSNTRALRHLLQEKCPDHLYLRYGDGMLQVMSQLHWIPNMLRWPVTLKSEALMMRGEYAYLGARRLKRLLTLFGLRFSPFTRIYMIDSIPFLYLRQH